MSAALDAKPDYAGYPRLTMDEARTAAEHLLAMRGAGRPVDDALHLSIQRFYSMEGRLLDEERYDDWYALLADDLFYWAPLHENRYRRDKRAPIRADNMAFFDECKADIAVRIGRFNSNRAWTEDPATRHVYIVANVEAFETQRDDELEVHSTFIQYRNRAEHDEAAIFGRRRDLLRCGATGYQIVRRLILLPQSILLTKNLSVFF